MSLFKQISKKVVENAQKDGAILQTIETLTPEQKKNVYFHVKSRLVDQGPQTAEELWNYVRTVYGFRIPLTATTEDSNAPFEWFYDYYFDKYTQTFAIGSRGGGKALALDTPVPTTDGYKNHGDLVVGDYVYGSDGRPTKVTEVHPIQYGKKCYNLRIEGEVFEADAEHLWPVLVNPNTFELPYRTILTSEECWNAYHFADAYLHIGVEGRSFTLDDIFEIDSVPVSCITVEAEDHLYLVGQSKIPTHNTYPATFGIDMKCRFRQNYEVVHVAAEKAQAKVSQGYIAGFYKDEYLRDYFARKPSAYAAEWKSGSTWRTVTASRSGISGSHPHQLTLDEIEFWPIDAIEQSFAVPQERNGYPAQHHMFSTRQRSYGSSNYLTNQIEQGRKQIKLYKWTIFETMQRCPTCVCMKGGRVISNPEQACALFQDCKGIRGLKSSGWVPREEVIKYRNTLDRKEWEVQYLCTRPSSHGLVLYNFEHVYASPADLDAGNFLKWEYAPELDLYAVHDPAEGQKSVFVFFQIYNGRIFFFDELVQQPCATVSEVKKELWKKLRKEGYPDPKKIIVDPHRTDAGMDWMMGTRTGEEIDRSYIVEYPDMTTGYAEIEKGLGLLRTFVCNGSQRRLYINPEKCPSLDIATREHHYRIPKGGELTDDAAPDKPYKDECDAMRYAVIWGTQFGGLKTFDLTIHLLG